MSEEHLDQQTQDRWFFLFFGLTALAVLLLFSSYLFVLLFAAVAAVASWPVFTWVLGRVGGRRTLASLLTLLLLLVVIFGPLTLLGYLFVKEATVLVAEGSSFIEGGGLDRWADDLSQDTPPQVTQLRAWASQWVPEGWLPAEGSVMPAVVEWGKTAVGNGLKLLGGAAPRLVEGVLGIGLYALLFLFALFSLYQHGPRLLTGLMRLSPMEDRYERQLFDVFRELANNMVLATLVTAGVQGLVAGIGYVIVGIDSVVFLGILTGVASFIPFVGTALVWAPVAAYVVATDGVGWAVFLVVWNLAMTGSVDNIVRPMLLRGNTHIHPLLILLAVFGGLGWFGVAGALVGPLVVALFLSAWTIYAREYLGVEPTIEDEGGPGMREWLVEKVPWLGRILGRPEADPPTER